MKLTSVQHAVLNVLCWQCRGGSPAQLSRVLSNTDQEVALALRGLRDARLVCWKNLPIPCFELSGPLAVWPPGKPRPDFAALAWQLEDRWCQSRRTVTRIIWATRLATRIVGGVSGRWRQPLQVQHDWGVTEVLAHRGTTSNERWVGEDAYRSYWPLDRKSKVPDAVLLNADEGIERVIEFGGRYPRERLENFHRFWARKGVCYEIW